MMIEAGQPSREKGTPRSSHHSTRRQCSCWLVVRYKGWLSSLYLVEQKGISDTSTQGGSTLRFSDFYTYRLPVAGCSLILMGSHFPILSTRRRHFIPHFHSPPISMVNRQPSTFHKSMYRRTKRQVPKCQASRHPIFLSFVGTEVVIMLETDGKVSDPLQE